MKNRKYHGWIFAEKAQGIKDHITVVVSATRDEKSITKTFGYGELAAAKAVDYFETDLGLGHIKLEPSPLGLRVFTWEPSLPVGEDLTKIGGKVLQGVDFRYCGCGNHIPKSRWELGFKVCGYCGLTEDS